jgi:hypothetical protein
MEWDYPNFLKELWPIARRFMRKQENAKEEF